jgi:peptidoglycan/LPS O-acetylase OafA/YrhL
VIGHSTSYFDVGFLWVQPDSRWWFRDGVTLFFIISGLLIYRSAERCIRDRRPVYHFYANRFLRVAPAIWFYLIVTVILVFSLGILPLQDATSPKFLAWAAATAALVPVYHPDIWEGVGTGVVNGALWTIPVEMSFYAVVPFLAWFAAKRSFNLMLALLGVVAISGLYLAWVFQVPQSETMIGKLYSITFLPFLWYFTLGIFWHRYWPTVPKSTWLAGVSLLAYGVARVTLGGFNETQNWEAYVGPVVWGIPFSYVAVWIGYRGPEVLSRLTARIGDLSFGVYIWHMIVINAILIYGTDLLEMPAANPVAHLVAVVVALGCGLASWRLIEKPALRLKPFTSRETAAATSAGVSFSRPSIEESTKAPARQPVSARVALHPDTRRLLTALVIGLFLAFVLGLATSGFG